MTVPTQAARVAGTAVALATGVLVAIQARINGELAQRIDDGVVAAALSNLGALVLLTGLVAARPRVRRGLGRVRNAVRVGELRPVYLLGGVGGALFLVCQGVTVGIIGVAVFTVAVVAGQAVSSLAVDRAGVGPGRPRPLSPRRVGGAVLALVAVALAVADRLGAPRTLWPALLPVLAGMGIAWQQAVNGVVGVVARGGGPVRAGMLPATLVNTVAGTIALAVAVAVEITTRGPARPLPVQPWLYCGGPLGVLVLSLAVAIVPITGVLLMGLATVTGQLIGAVLLEQFVPAGQHQLSSTTLAGTALALVAVAVIALPSWHRVGRHRD